MRLPASGFRALVPLWQKLGDAERATRCALRAVRCDDLVEDLRRGSPKLLGWLALESAGRGEWEVAARYEERAAQVEHDAAMASDDVMDLHYFRIDVYTGAARGAEDSR